MSNWQLYMIYPHVNDIYVVQNDDGNRFEDGDWVEDYLEGTKSLRDGDDPDWSRSEIIWVHDCPDLDVSIDDYEDTRSYIQTIAEWPVFLVENIPKLYLKQFKVGYDVRNQEEIKGVCQLQKCFLSSISFQKH